MESGTVAGPMPDLKAIPCDLSVSAPSANCSMDLERRAAELPAPLSVLGGPLPLYPDGSHQGAPGQCASVPAFHSSALLANLGLQCCPGSGAVPLKHRVPPAPGLSPPPALCVNAASSRLYRSMENLHWAALPDPGLLAFSAPYGSVDSEFIFRCTATSHWSEGMAFCPAPRASARRDLPLLPHWLFPGGGEAVLNGGARRGLREKLRLHSVRVTEPNKPLRPLASPGPPEPRPSNGRPGCRITSPEEIKQEALRRLQLRRQNSSPDLTLHPPEEPRPSKSRTAEALGPPVLRRPPAGRLHIPTFEEFKKMRKKESGQSELRSATGGQSGAETGGSKKGQTVADTGGGDCVGGPGADETCGGESGGVGTARGVAGVGGAGMVGMGGDGAEVAEGGEQAGRAESNSDCRRSHSTAERCDCNRDSRNEGRQACLDRGTDPSAVPICTSPTPRTPLQPLATPHEAEVGGTTSNAEDDVSHLTPTTLLPNSRAPPTCCPALLLDSTDLSSYGAKISKMKDGFLGSALDLIKKSCSAEIAAEAPVRLARDQDAADITPPQPGRQSAAVSMTMPACSAEDHNKPSSGGGEPAERQQPRSGCRRSSSDAAYELAESAKTQRECRLRPHFSDPMPASTTKRKQLEMKIAAVARLHSQHRDFDDSSGQPEPGVGVTRGGGGMGLSVSQGTQHRWSNVSSLSADSGVMGLSDERDEREDDEEPPRARRSAGDVERADSGIGPGLALGWKRPPASLGAWEAHQACTDCGQRDRGGRHGGMCERCLKQRTERKEAVLEFLNTESSYGEDLRIIKEEFLCPMQSAGLLTPEQLAVVFGNVQELIDVNDKFTEHLQDSIEQAFDQGDEDLQSVCIGEIFLEFSNMLPAFQTYCLQQSAAVNMLNALEKEKELLRIFLDVSQNDNTALRRMNLRSFLMAPLQRVTKYPLLLSRISKATAESHADHGRLREAKSRVESHLEHVNTRTKQEGASWSLRSFRRDSRRSREVANMEMRELCMRTVGWARESTRFVMEGPLQISQPADGQWVKKGSKALKFQNLQSLLMVQVQGVTEGTQDCGGLRGQEAPPEPVRDGVLVLIKDKSSGKFSVLREPIRLGNCVVSSDPECEDTFEVLDIRREAFVLRAADKSRTQQWFRQIKRYSRDLGPWRKRRNALPNIMISTTQNRS